MSENDKSDHLGLLTLFNIFLFGHCLLHSELCAFYTEFTEPALHQSLGLCPGQGLTLLELSDTPWI